MRGSGGSLQNDLDEIVSRNHDDFVALRGARLFVTGGTGFVGSWLLESFAWANRRLALNAKLTALTRDPLRFGRSVPHLASDPAIDFHTGDVRGYIDVVGAFDAIVHAATPASALINSAQPELMLETVVDGTRRVLEVAERGGRIPFLLTSSGAVYGRQPLDLPLIDEVFGGAPDSLEPSNAYHESKRLSELMCAIASKASIEAKIGRLFAFVGPYLPLDRHFAIGNFIRDAVAGVPIAINGSGSPVRTYLYAADMTSWLWRLLLRGKTCRAYNVGSERCITIRETAELVATSVEPRAAVHIKNIEQGHATSRYACSTERARSELGLQEWTPLEEAISRTIAWNRTRFA